MHFVNALDISWKMSIKKESTNLIMLNICDHCLTKKVKSVPLIKQTVNSLYKS